MVSAGSDAAVIVNSGSTNTPAYRIVVDRSGTATYNTTRGEASASKLPQAVAERFYKDLDAAKPLSGLHAPKCLKSASFGSTLIVEFGGDKSPDLSCGDGGSGKLAALIRDTGEITKAFTDHRE
jgi:hypothetical protein